MDSLTIIRKSYKAMTQHTNNEQRTTNSLDINSKTAGCSRYYHALPQQYKCKHSSWGT